MGFEIYSVSGFWKVAKAKKDDGRINEDESKEAVRVYDKNRDKVVELWEYLEKVNGQNKFIYSSEEIEAWKCAYEHIDKVIESLNLKGIKSFPSTRLLFLKSVAMMTGRFNVDLKYVIPEFFEAGLTEKQILKVFARITKGTELSSRLRSISRAAVALNKAGLPPDQIVDILSSTADSKFSADMNNDRGSPATPKGLIKSGYFSSLEEVYRYLAEAAKWLKSKGVPANKTNNILSSFAKSPRTMDYLFNGFYDPFSKQYSSEWDKYKGLFELATRGLPAKKINKLLGILGRWPWRDKDHIPPILPKITNRLIKAGVKVDRIYILLVIASRSNKKTPSRTPYEDLHTFVMVGLSDWQIDKLLQTAANIDANSNSFRGSVASLSIAIRVLRLAL